MRITTDYAPLFGKVERSFEGAADDTLAEARATAPRRSGEYAGSLERRGSGLSSTIGSPLPQAGAVERGADVGPRRGPHMGPVGTLREAGDRFPERMTSRLRGS